MSLRKVVLLVCASMFVMALTTGKSLAEVSEVRIAKQPGLGYLPLVIMEGKKLVENQARQRGLGDIQVKWMTFAGGNVMNDALLSGSLDFASGGVTPLVTLWAKSNGEVKGVCAQTTMQIYVNTRNPNVRSVKDFTAADKIALPAVKVSVNAVLLQMAAEQAFGPDQHGKLDPLTVTQSYAEGNVSILAGRSEINSTFAASPFHERQLKTPGIHTVLKSYDVLGGPATNNLIWTTKKFHDANPKVYAAYLAAFEEAIQFIKSNKKQAATLYRDITGDKSSSEEELIVILNDPNLDYTTTPMNIQKYADFMQKIGTIKAKPKSWKDLFFSEIHDKPGS